MAQALPEVELTRLLQAWSQGDQSALDVLTPLVHGQLHQLARRQLAGERAGHVLQPTALVNEAFLRLGGSQQVEWANRAQFFAIAARLMRQILIDFARNLETQKRGQRAVHLEMGAVRGVAAPDAGVDLHSLLDIDRALNRLAELDLRQAQLVELRFFGGLENSEIARYLGVSEATIARDWRLARAWLFDALTPQC